MRASHTPDVGGYVVGAPAAILERIVPNLLVRVEKPRERAAPLLDHADPAVIAAANSFGLAALGVMDYATNPDNAQRLWGLSERLTADRNRG